MLSIRRYNLAVDSLIHSNATCKIVPGFDKYTGEKIIAKIFRIEQLDADKRDRCEREIKILKLLQGHKNIVRMLDSFRDEENIFIIMEFMNEDLLSFFERKHWKLEKKMLKTVARQLVEVTAFMHENLVVHCDLKLENFLFDEKTATIKVIDFGQSFLLSSRRTYLRGICGTKRYVAPEVYLKEREGWDPFACDVYSLGVVLFALVFGRMPFSDRDGFDYYQKLFATVSSKNDARRVDLVFPPSASVSTDLQKLFERILSLDPMARPSPEEILHAPFFQQNQKKLKNLFHRLSRSVHRGSLRQ
jgi:serine/threonine protein kinase